MLLKVLLGLVPYKGDIGELIDILNKKQKSFPTIRTAGKALRYKEIYDKTLPEDRMILDGIVDIIWKELNTTVKVTE